MKEQKIYPLIIESYASGGEGVARMDGQVVFVKGAVVGESCRVRIDKIGKSAAWGSI